MGGVGGMWAECGGLGGVGWRVVVIIRIWDRLRGYAETQTRTVPRLSLALLRDGGEAGPRTIAVLNRIRVGWWLLVSFYVRRHLNIRRRLRRYFQPQPTPADPSPPQPTPAHPGHPSPPQPAQPNQAQHSAPHSLLSPTQPSPALPSPTHPSLPHPTLLHPTPGHFWPSSLDHFSGGSC
jgi:hypothetical protein